MNGDNRSLAWKRPMRRSSKVLSHERCVELLRRERVGRLGLTDGTFPYVVPVFFSYLDGKIIIHSAREGLKIDILSTGHAVCFEVDTLLGFQPGDRACTWGAHYESVMCFGQARLSTDPGEKRDLLDALCCRYSVDGIPPLAQGDLAEVDGVCVIVIEVDHMTGKGA
ncbi:MAG: pyridoxamine 5'-phosphate oxidase family protein [Bacillota bacterium]|jgi:nitroimidazol reductase NimA-like FMN-containing flavoprotein (pyridoxamine 5'-phosphate oxidase superfamily)